MRTPGPQADGETSRLCDLGPPEGQSEFDLMVADTAVPARPASLWLWQEEQISG